ncbi:MAG: hypothetical protein QFB87_04920 [Patescibacteria group bacterium]|nr:hypothetical protein [Patescibacteria group bacterium]
MNTKLTDRQKINAELAARASNKLSADKLAHHVPAEEQHELEIAFACECADANCTDRLDLTLKEYAQLHNKYARFIVATGHVDPTIEKVTISQEDLQVVEKFALAD